MNAKGFSRQLWRIIKITIGFVVLLVGIILILLPGPAVIVIPAGLAILASEFKWAKGLLVWFEGKFKKLSKKGSSDKKT